jgi:hypothetical protein
VGSGVFVGIGVAVGTAVGGSVGMTVTNTVATTTCAVGGTGVGWTVTTALHAVNASARVAISILFIKNCSFS